MLIRHQPAKPLECEFCYFARWLVCGECAARNKCSPRLSHLVTVIDVIWVSATGPAMRK
jgi:hypothetical protein